MKLNYTAAFSLCFAWLIFNPVSFATLVLTTQVGTPVIGGGNTFADVNVNIYGSYQGTAGGSEQVGAFGFYLDISGPGAVSIPTPLTTSATMVTPASGVTSSWAGLNNAGAQVTTGAVPRITFRAGASVGEQTTQPYNVTIAGVGPQESTFIGSVTFRVTTSGSYSLVFAPTNSPIFSNALTGFIRSDTSTTQSVLPVDFPTVIVPVSITAVPEPSSIALIGCTLLGGGLARWRKRKRQL